MYAMQIGKLLRLIRLPRKNHVQVGDHIRSAGRLLIEILLRTPDRVVLNSVKIRKHRRFFTELRNRIKLSLDRAVIDQNIRILCDRIKGFHLNVHGRERVVVNIERIGSENIPSARKPDHL